MKHDGDPIAPFCRPLRGSPSPRKATTCGIRLRMTSSRLFLHSSRHPRRHSPNVLYRIMNSIILPSRNNFSFYRTPSQCLLVRPRGEREIVIELQPLKTINCPTQRLAKMIMIKSHSTVQHTGKSKGSVVSTHKCTCRVDTKT
jgi:hypothetical protein